MELSEQFRHAVEEYRFQVDLNWKRSEYYFVLNIAVLVAAIGLLAASDRVPRGLIGVLFLIAALLAALSIVANVVQHGYYRAARDEVRRLREALELPQTALATTPGIGARVRRLARVKTFQVIMLSALLGADVVGAAYSFTSEAEARTAAVVLHVRATTSAAEQERLVIVVSADDRVRRTLSARPGQDRVVRLPYGEYLASTLARGRLCQRRFSVGARQLAELVLRCPAE